jgi:dipeptidyl aminopeptidase/acylaminoacyl peptidase
MLRQTALFLLALACLPAIASQAGRGFTADDLVSLERIAEPRLSPDGQRLVFTLRETDLAANRMRTDLWLLDLAQSVPAVRRLTQSDADDSGAEWAPDGSIYFLSARSGSRQVWRLPPGGGEAVRVTQLPVEVTTFRLAPKAGRLVFSAEAFRDCPDLECTRRRLDAAAASKASGRTYDRLFVRHWDRWKDGRVGQLFSVALDAGGRAQGVPVSLSGSLDADVPSKPLGTRDDYAVSPDGARVVFAARLKGQGEAWSTNFDLFEVPTAGGADPVNLTAANLAWDARPAFSPDGRTLAYVAMQRPGFEADRFELVLRDMTKGAIRRVATDWDRSVAHHAWSPDGRTLYAATDHVGQHPLWAVDAKSGKRRQLTSAGTVLEFTAAGGRIIASMQSLGSPAQLYAVPAAGGEPVIVAAFNRERLKDVRFGESEQFSFEGAHGDTVYGYVVKPWNFQAGERYPIAFLVHGGPQSTMANNWNSRWNPQVFAGAGYASVMIDFHGSTGYGQRFTDSISRDWGGAPLEDLQKGLAAALARYPWLDGARACALGGSYGGFMMNWIAGNWPDGFRCIVNHAGLFDPHSMYYSTEELWFPEWDQGGPYFGNPAGHEKFNPSSLVERWKTPQLVIHGELDYRVPYTQGLMTFTALQRRGIESRFLYFPDENHWIVKPANSLQWHREVLAWLDRHTGR